MQTKPANLKRHARFGAPPEEGLAVAVPGKDAVGIGINQCCNVKLATHRQKAAGRRFRPPRLFDRWERLAGRQSGQRKSVGTHWGNIARKFAHKKSSK